MSLTTLKLHWYVGLCVAALQLPQRLSADEVDFNRDIASILEERCWSCHGEDEQESGLRLDLRVKALRGGDSGLAAVVPGRPDKSYLIDVVRHLDADVKMPPDEDKMPPVEIELLTRWIQQGAIWPGQMEAVADDKTDHWSFQSVVRPAVPDVATSSANPVDAFLFSELSERDLSFSKPADSRSLIRRVSIVLTGLPPTPDEMEQFLDACDHDVAAAYEALVDRLLASPHFGERWTQHWLDVIRWSETNGSEANLYRKNAWVYRDYLVRSFNEDKPYDRFIQEQIAGDSMGVGEATGFLVAGPHVPAATVGREPAAIRQARADRMDEIMQTVGASVMGVTIGCARCHNHKFDPVTINDYYAMTAVFQDIEFGSRQPEYSQAHPLRQRGAELRRLIAAERVRLRQFGGWEEDWGAYREVHFLPATTTAVRIRFKMKNVGLDELEILGAAGTNENFAHRRRGTKISGFPAEGTDGRNPLSRVNDGEYGTMAWRARGDKDSEERPTLRFDFVQPEQISRLRLSSNREYFYDTDYLDRKPYLPRYEFDLDILTDDGDWKPWVGTWSINRKLNEKHAVRKSIIAEIQRLIMLLSEEGPRPSFVGRFVQPGVTRVLLRGSPESPRDEVMPAGPAILGGNLGLTSETPGAKRRAEFAKWITSSDCPLTTRVMVNRIWHHVFGRGIVPTTSDFGKAGALPTHPELLDWLAAEFVSPTVSKGQPWSTKTMIRMIVMSEAFRQSSSPDPSGIAADAASEYLWRFPPQRVEAEVIRDSILQASGSLNRSIGGRGYRIHNTKKTYAQWQVVNNYGPDTWRRMLYQERMRRVDDLMFTAFDFPDCGQVRAMRPVSTTPLQALNLMNSLFVIEQSKRIADCAVNESDSDVNGAVHRCFELLVGRLPDADELTECLTLAREEDLSLVCRAIINSNEFAFLP